MRSCTAPCFAFSSRAFMMSARIFSTSMVDSANRSVILLTRAASLALTTTSTIPSGCFLLMTAAYRTPYFLASSANSFKSFALIANTFVGLPLNARIRALPLVRFSSFNAATRNVARDKAPLPARLVRHSTPLTVTFVAILTICSAASPCWLMLFFDLHFLVWLHKKDAPLGGTPQMRGVFYFFFLYRCLLLFGLSGYSISIKSCSNAGTR